jgi:hypothetical protein
MLTSIGNNVIILHIFMQLIFFKHLIITTLFNIKLIADALLLTLIH